MIQPVIGVLIADDHPIFRQGLIQVIQQDAQLKVVAEAATGEEALAQVALTRPQIALVDVDMPSMDGFDLARVLRGRHSSVKVVFLTLYKDETHLNEALDVGAAGYLVKDSAAADIVQCLKTVAAGRLYVSPGLSDYLLSRAGKVASPEPPENSLLNGLTPAERRILSHLADYKTNKQIAVELGISVRTIENHRANICEKLGLQGSHALVRFAIRSCQKPH